MPIIIHYNEINFVQFEYWQSSILQHNDRSAFLIEPSDTEIHGVIIVSSVECTYGCRTRKILAYCSPNEAYLSVGSVVKSHTHKHIHYSHFTIRGAEYVLAWVFVRFRVHVCGDKLHICAIQPKKNYIAYGWHFSPKLCRDSNKYKLSYK